MRVFRQYSTRIFPESNFHPIANYLCSSVQMNKLPSPSAQKAILATAIIKEIIGSSLPMNFQDEPLRSKILNLNPLIQNQEISGSIKRQMMSLFTTGIQLNAHVFKQNRISIGEQPSKTNENLENFIFCPNYLTTRQIFNILIWKTTNERDKQRNIFLYGGSGISKTISIILYIHLSNHIHHYYHQVIQAKKGDSIQQQYEMLMEKKLIQIVPKCWYWSIDPEKHGNYDFKIQDLILEQIEELSNQEKESLKRKAKFADIYQFKQQLKTSYPKIYRKSIVDQIDVLACIAKTYNLQQNVIAGLQTKKAQNFQQQKENDANIKSLLKQQEKHKQTLRLIKVQLQKYRKCGDNCIYNSAVKIQRNLGLGIYRHDQPSQILIEYQSLLKKQKWAEIDFWHFFWFELQRIIANWQVKTSISKIKQLFFEKCKEIAEVKSYYRFIYIKTFLQGKMHLLRQISIQHKQSKILQQIGNLIKKFNLTCIKKMTQKLKRLVEKDNYKQEISNLEQLYRQTQKLIFRQEQFLSYKIDTYKADLILQIQNFKLIKEDFEKLTLFRSSSVHDNTTTSEFNLSPYEIAQISAGVLYPSSLQYIPLGKGFKAFLKNYEGPRDHLYKAQLLTCLQSGTQLNINGFKFDIVGRQKFTSFSAKNLRMNNLQQDHQNKSTNKSKVKNTSQHKSQDNPFDEPYNHLVIEQYCTRLLQKCHQNPSNYIVGIPYKWQYGQYVFDHDSPSIDFVIASKLQSHYNFITYEITLTRNKSQIYKKRKAAIAFFKRLIKQNKNSFVIQHTIICKDRFIPKKIEEKHKGFTINYVDWKMLKMQNKDQKISNQIDAFEKTIQQISNLQQQYDNTKRIKNSLKRKM